MNEPLNPQSLIYLCNGCEDKFSLLSSVISNNIECPFCGVKNSSYLEIKKK